MHASVTEMNCGGLKTLPLSMQVTNAIPRDNIHVFLEQLAMPPARLAKCLMFHNQVVPKLGTVKPVVVIQLPPHPGIMGLTYDLAALLLTILSSIAKNRVPAQIAVRLMVRVLESTSGGVS